MARLYKPVDIASILTLVIKEATGQDTTPQAVATAGITSVGESLLTLGTENVMNALSTVIFRDLIAVRPYTARFKTLRAESTGMYANRLRKISFYAKNPMNSGEFNTVDPNGTTLYTNLADGFTAGQNLDVNGVPQSTKSQWEQVQAYPLELHFGGSSVWQDGITRYENALKIAFRSETDFADFVEGFVREKLNDIESQKEAYSRTNVLSLIGGTVAMGNTLMPQSTCYLITEFNNYFGTSYTKADIPAHLTEFAEFFTYTIKTDVRRFQNRSTLFHYSPAKVVDGVNYYVLRHTPREQQRLLVIADWYTKVESLVKPQIFNDQLLDINNFEEVDFWQNEVNPYSINVIPPVIDTNTGEQKPAASAVEVDVLATLHDKDACMVEFMLDAVRTTSVEAKKGYFTTWYSFCRNSIVDYTEKIRVYLLEEDPNQ